MIEHPDSRMYVIPAMGGKVAAGIKGSEGEDRRGEGKRRLGMSGI